MALGMALCKTLRKKKNIICPVILLSSRVNIGYRCFVIDIETALLECWIMQSWDFDTLLYVDKEVSKITGILK